jgi:hypothetical protein
MPKNGKHQKRENQPPPLDTSIAVFEVQNRIPARFATARNPSRVKRFRHKQTTPH